VAHRHTGVLGECCKCTGTVSVCVVVFSGGEITAGSSHK
jgi:hypothetical protein